MNVRKENTAFRSTNIEIVPFKIKQDANNQRKMTIVQESDMIFKQVVAGYNHSMAITCRKK